MHEDLPQAPPVVPRPRAPEGPMPAIADRFRALRADARVGAAAVIAVALAAGAFWYRSATATSAYTSASTTGTAGPGVEGQAPAATATSRVDSTAATAAPVVVVHVAGAVHRPGVVTLPAGSRVVDAIDAAGGGLPDADLDRLNLAALLADGVRVLVAHIGDPPTGADGAVTGGGVVSAPAGPLDLNSATQADLEELPGIGPTLATAIITERDRRGGFTDVVQLRQVPGIGESRYAQIRDLVGV